MEDQNNQATNETSAPQKTNMLPIVIVILLLIVGGAFFFKNMQSASLGTPDATLPPVSSDQTPSGDVLSNNIDTTQPTSTPVTSGPVKEFTINGSSFKFGPASISVNKGDTVKITFKDDGGSHNLVVDGYGVSTDTLESGDSGTITFVANKAGTFDYYCSVDSHREKGMVGKLTVK